METHKDLEETQSILQLVTRLKKPIHLILPAWAATLQVPTWLAPKAAADVRLNLLKWRSGTTLRTDQTSMRGSCPSTDVNNTRKCTTYTLSDARNLPHSSAREVAAPLSSSVSRSTTSAPTATATTTTTTTTTAAHANRPQRSVSAPAEYTATASPAAARSSPPTEAPPTTATTTTTTVTHANTIRRSVSNHTQRAPADSPVASSSSSTTASASNAITTTATTTATPVTPGGFVGGFTTNTNTNTNTCPHLTFAPMNPQPPPAVARAGAGQPVVWARYMRFIAPWGSSGSGG